MASYTGDYLGEGTFFTKAWKSVTKKTVSIPNPFVKKIPKLIYPERAAQIPVSVGGMQSTMRKAVAAPTTPSRWGSLLKTSVKKLSPVYR